MASGGFHGGGGHSGGHHGGGFGGGFGGSGFSGGGYSGGGFSGGGYSGNGDESLTGCFSAYAIVGFVIFLYMLAMVLEGFLPGLNWLNLIIFFVSIFFYLYGLKEYDRTSVVSYFLKGYVPSFGMRIWKGDRPYGISRDRKSWAKSKDCFCISFFDKEYGEENKKKVGELIGRTPKILWLNLFMWMWIGFVCMVVNLFFYEAVIPFFERATMSDQAFKFFDEFIFYLPSLLCLLSSLICCLIVKIRDKLLYQCAVRVVGDIDAAEERLKTEEFITSQLSRKWYYNNCPNCGAEASKALRSCTFCGASLEVKSFDYGLSGAVHRISAADEEADKHPGRRG
ncbi:hypothetical protein [Butyrivibrio sp. AE2032]|uniref:hypothetical protein n=1 Tax=Butyrivibrio sp. AE2032 TaxID=1458463 RepID=UPI00054F67A4|nr:hypothetical protein [Butyrivibrio sp. AE2032]